MQNFQLIVSAIDEVLIETGRERTAGLSVDTKLRLDLGFDSLDLAVLTVKIESKTGVDVFAKGIVNTVGEILRQIDEK